MAASERLATVALALGFGLLAQAGCGDDSEPDPAPPAGPIAYTVSGGYPPFSRELEIDPGGEARLTVSSIGRGKQPIRFTVPADVVADLQADLQAAGIGDLTPGRSECADCIVHEIEFGGETLMVDMLSIPRELEPAFNALDQVIDAVPEARDASSGAATR